MAGSSESTIPPPTPKGIWIIDFNSSGDVLSWDCSEDAIRTKLEKTKFNDETRLIIFDPNRIYIQNHVDSRHDIDPGFFEAADRPPHVSEFLVGGQPQYLDLGYGWTAIFKCSNNFNIVLVSALGYRAGPGGIFMSSHHKYYKALLNRDAIFFADAHKTPLLLLLPVLDIHATTLSNVLTGADSVFRSRTYSNAERLGLMEEAWRNLRLMRYDGMNPLKCIEAYSRRSDRGGITGSEEYKSLKERFRCIEDQIALTEALARGLLQHEVGRASLEESRASIKQAKISLEESRRTKLITVLAIFFVPISLSTSVFGMNIHELNENGQPLWVFILTTILIVAATMIAWGTMYQWQKYHSLSKGGYGEGKSWLTRFHCFLQLVFYGHSVWAWKSGILLSLLVDGRVAFLRSCSDHDCDEYLNILCHNTKSPCAYINGHLGGETGFKLSDLEDQ